MSFKLITKVSKYPERITKTFERFFKLKNYKLQSARLNTQLHTKTC